MEQYLNKIGWKQLSWLALFIIFCLKVYLVFWQFNYYNFLVPPSPDLVAHTSIVDSLLSGKVSWTGYPPLMHWLFAKISLLFSVAPLDLFRIIGPYWLLVVIPPFYWLVNVMYGYKTAFWSTAIYMLVSTSPLLNFADAQYPDIIGYNLLGPIYLGLMILSVRKKKIVYALIGIALLILIAMFHNLSLVLLYLVTLVTVGIHLFLSRDNNAKLNRTKLGIFSLLILVGLVGAYLSSQYSGGLIKQIVNSLIHLKPLVNDRTSAVIEYSSIQALLPPFLEFIGFGGLGVVVLYLYQKKSTVFPDILLLSWVGIIWLLSRSDLFVLPQRIFREMSLPLSIASGIFVAGILETLPTRMSKILVAGIAGYLIIINTSQLFVNPFLLPDGLKNMVWYKQVDEEKYQSLQKWVPKDEVLVTNYSNPILNYKLKKDGYQITEFAGVVQPGITGLSDEQLYPLVASSMPKLTGLYVFIGQMPEYTDPDIYFHQFNNFVNATKHLETFVSKQTVLQTYPDGSKLYYIE